MNREMAENIARDFLGKLNPEMWNGNGEKPKSFNDYNYEAYDVGKDDMLYIQFEYDKNDGWYHNCSLYNEECEQTMETLSGYGVDSMLNLADTILDICK